MFSHGSDIGTSPYHSKIRANPGRVLAGSVPRDDHDERPPRRPARPRYCKVLRASSSVSTSVSLIMPAPMLRFIPLPNPAT